MSKISKQRYEEIKSEIEEAKNAIQELWVVYAQGRELHSQDRNKKHLLNKVFVVFLAAILEGVGLKPSLLKDKDNLTNPEKYFLTLHALRNSIVHSGGILKFSNRGRIGIKIKSAYEEVSEVLTDLTKEEGEELHLSTDTILQPLLAEVLKYLESKIED